jgi:hypothetical protein
LSIFAGIIRKAGKRSTCFIIIVLFLYGLMPSGNSAAASQTETQEISPYATLADTLTGSVLATGRWYKIKITSANIYKLTYEDITSMGFTDPQNVRIFGNGGRMVPVMNNEPRYHDLVENAVYMNKGADNVFNAGDYILFYGQGPVVWHFNEGSGMYEHEKHLFSNASYYFVTTGAGGKKINAAEPVTGTPAAFVTSFDAYDYHEKDRYNFLKSGQQWFGERIDLSPWDTVFSFPGLVTSSPVKLKTNAVSRSAGKRTVTFKNGDAVIGSSLIDEVILSNYTGTYAEQKSSVFSFAATGSQIRLNVSYNKSESSDEGFIDYLILNARRSLSLAGDVLFFRNRTATDTSADVAEFSVGNAAGTTEIWDITDIFNIKKINTYTEGGFLKFRTGNDPLAEYAAVNTAGTFPAPVFRNDVNTGLVDNQNLHGTAPCQMLIVTHPLFSAAADSIAKLHREKDGLSVTVVTTRQIYNEFSSGAVDISAIRDFARLIYGRATGSSDRLRYLLLVGDGSYNNLSQSAGNSNFIPTYQSYNSLNASVSYVTDDFFGFMDANEGGSGIMESYFLDLGVGRLPVKTASEAVAVFRKLKSYMYDDNFGDWRNNIMVIGDDEDANIHMQQANELADWISGNYPEFAVKKVLLDAYRQTSGSSGSRYPDVNRIIFENIHKGILIFNYTGHGGERGLSAEQILMRDDIQKLTNGDRLPLFVTATCEFSRFDDLLYDGTTMLESTSAGEVSLLNPQGGSIGLISTTRIVYSDRNHYLNMQLYRFIFEHDSEGNRYRLGDIIRLTKDSTGVEKNKLNFILLGDPALTLAVPEYKVVTDSLNGMTVSEPVDTLKAFSKIRITGHIENNNNTVQENYSGMIYPSVYDKPVTVTTLANDGGDTMQFELQEKMIFKGKTEVSNGRFSFEFIVPKDISYSMGNGKILYYADDSHTDAHGMFNSFTIGGTDPGGGSDITGPDIAIYMNDENFHNMGITNTSPVIYARISDASGINMTGNGIGHDITGIIDGNTVEPVILNDFYETLLNDFTSGTITYPMHDLEEGPHSLKIKAWDVFNNSSEETIEFRVISSAAIVLANTFNYPNPATDHTWFHFENNRPDDELFVTVEIYDMSGQLVIILKDVVSSSGFSSEIYWDVSDSNGNSLKKGIYPYRLTVSDRNGSFAESHEKLIVTGQ